MTNLSPDLIQLLIQGGFAALAVWLIVSGRIDSLARERASTDREQALMKAAQEREDKLQSLLDNYSQQLPRITDMLTKIEGRMEKIERDRDAERLALAARGANG